MARLILKNIVEFIKNKIIFVLFSMGIVVTLLVVLFLYNIYANMNASDPSMQSKYQVATISLSGLTVEEIDRAFTQLNSQREDIAFAFSIFQDGDNMIAATHMNAPYNYSGRYFKNEEIDAGAAVAILAGSLHEAYNENTHMIIKGKPYKILAYSDRFYTEIPFYSLEGDAELDTMQILFKNMLSQSRIKILERELAQAFPGAFINPPSEPDLRAVSQNLYRSALSALILIVALLNISFLYQYILKKREKCYGVYRICGCSAFKGFFLYFLEIVLLTTILYIFTVLIFHFGVERLLPFINKTLTYSLFLLDYLIIYVPFILLVSIIFIPVIIGFNRKKPIELLR